MNVIHEENNSTISIFLGADENYAPFLCTTMYSILQNTTKQIAFYILDEKILDKTKELIRESLKNFNHFSIEYLDIYSSNFVYLKDLKLKHHWSKGVYARYFIAEMKPDLKKALYLDVDIIVQCDIVELFYQDIENYPLGAILEDFYLENYTALKENVDPQYQGGSNYFNTGVLLMDLEKFREHNFAQQLLDTTIEKVEFSNLANQDMYNIVFQNNFKILDYIYNYMPDHYSYLKELHPTRAEEIRNNAKIVHFTSGKPWKHASIASDIFWEYANKTAFKEILIEKYLTLSTKDKIKRCKYYVLSKITFGKAKKRYSNKYQKLSFYK